jgi:hypothetical protein
MHLPDLFAVVPEDRAERWRRLAAFIEGWWSPLRPEDGAPERDLRQAEETLGLPLPAALREGYARFGQRREIATSFDTLRPAWFLHMPDGLLFVWHSRQFEWFVRHDDLALPDPPVRMRYVIGHEWEEHAALQDDPSVSRFFVWKALEQAIFGCRYGNVAGGLGPAEPLAAEVGRRFPLLGFGTVEHPRPSTRLYGGEDALVAVLCGREVKLLVSASTLAGYRRAMDALGDLALPWKNTTDAEAFRGEFHEQWPGEAWGTRGRPAAVKASLRGERDPPPAPPPMDDCAAESASDLDPRVAVLVDAAMRPYERLLPWRCRVSLRAALELAIETASPLQACANVLVGKPATDDVVMPPPEPLPPELRARLEAISTNPELWAYLEAVRGSGLIEKFMDAHLRRHARTEHHRPLTPTEQQDDEAMWHAEIPMHDLLYELPAEPVPDRAAAEAVLSRTLRRLATSVFAALVVGLGPRRLEFRFLDASSAWSRRPSSEDARRIGQTYYVERRKVVDVAQALGVPVAVEVERHCAFLDGVARAIEEGDDESDDEDEDEAPAEEDADE